VAGTQAKTLADQRRVGEVRDKVEVGVGASDRRKRHFNDKIVAQYETSCERIRYLCERSSLFWKDEFERVLHGPSGY
jgi:hypothetical protein